MLARYYTKKVKAHKLQYEMRKLKERDERKRTLDTRIYPDNVITPVLCPDAPPVKPVLKTWLLGT